MLFQANIARCPIQDNSIDLIFCDPPYHAKYLHLYDWLAREAARILKPGAFLLAMCGGMNLYDNMMLMGKYLTWFWNYEVFLESVSTVIWNKRTIARNKPIVAFVKGSGMPRCNVLSGLYGGGNDKRYHHWGQDVESARYYIDCFSKPGDIVYDPCVGGGTTLVASALIGRIGIGSDIDMAALEICGPRLSNAEIPKQELLFGL